MSRTASPRVPALVSTALTSVLRGAPRPVTVLARFPQAAYLTVDGEVAIIALVTADGIAQPNALVLNVPATTRPLAPLSVGLQGHVGGGRLLLGGLDVRAARWWDPHPRLPHCAAHRLQVRTATTRQRMLEIAGPTPPSLTIPLTALGAGLERRDLAAARAAADRLIGLGPGLTPAGDDVLAGLLAGVLTLDAAASLAEDIRHLGRDVATTAVGRTTSVSAALLAHAAQGQLATPAADLLRTWTSPPRPGDTDRVLAATDQLLGVGSTSGRDLTLGLLAAADLITAFFTKDPSPTPPLTLSGRPN